MIPIEYVAGVAGLVLGAFGGFMYGEDHAEKKAKLAKEKEYQARIWEELMKKMGVQR